MIDLYFWPTPNGQKVSIALEELGLPYRVVPVNIGAGEQFQPSFLAISPNNRMPAIVDHDPIGGGAPISIFESGAILLYLAEKSGRLISKDPAARYDAIQWVMWQMAGLGPMSGQAFHFRHYAKEPLPYAIDRYTNEVNRLYGVLERRLADRDFLTGELSIADIATYPWMLGWEKLGQSMGDFPRVDAWMKRLAALPSVERGMDVGKDLRKPMTDEAKKVLFQQTAATIRQAETERR